METNRCRTLEERTKDTDCRQMKRIDILPDDVLLEIFDFCTNAPISRWPIRKKDIEAWLSLIHVCGRWRMLVFAAPRRLNLKLCCTPRTPVKDKLDIWPALPLVVIGTRFGYFSDIENMKGWDNVIAVLGHSNRIREVDLGGLTNQKLEQVSAAMHVPFPELTQLRLFFVDETPPPVMPDSFLGGSAPRLQNLSCSGIPYPGLPNLLLSAIDLVYLWIHRIPYSGYISPKAIVASLSALSRLRILNLEFDSLPELETRHPPPSKRSILPALSRFTFKGTTEYLEDLLSRIDSPQLENLCIEFFDEIDLDFPLLVQFIDRTPMLKAPDEATVTFGDCTTNVHYRVLCIKIKCEPDQQVLSIAQACSTSISSTVEDLFIERQRQLDLKKEVNDAIENALWLQLFLPFTAVKYLYLYKEFAPAIAAALQELVGDEITEVLPNLRDIFVEDLEPLAFEENFAKFVVARRLSGYPVTISDWDRESSDREKDPSDWGDYSDSDIDSDM